MLTKIKQKFIFRVSKQYKNLANSEDNQFILKILICIPNYCILCFMFNKIYNNYKIY